MKSIKWVDKLIPIHNISIRLVIIINSYHEHLPGKEHPKNHILQLISLIVFLTTWILDSFIFKFSIGLAIYVSWVFRLILFLIVSTFGLLTARSAEKSIFQEIPESPTIIDTGILAHVRHPLYLGVLLIYLGFVLGTFSLVSLFVFIIIALIYNLLATYEEQDLERVFGGDYLDYKKRVPMWIPRLTAAKPTKTS